MLIAEISALGAAFCWAITGLISIYPIRKLGPFAFNRIRMTIVFFLLAVISLITGSWRVLSVSSFQVLMFSGIIGIFLGDTALFASLQRLGPSRSAIIFALNAPMTVILGWFLLEEYLSTMTLIGCGLVFVGVLIAIIGRRNYQEPLSIDSTQGSVGFGIIMGLFAAFGQAAGTIIARPILSEGFDPVTAAAVRVGIAAFLLILLGFLPNTVFKPKSRYTLDLIGMIILSGFLAMGLGMTLLLYGLSLGETGVITTLSATTPVLILPLLWIKTGSRPPLLAWIGAVVSLFGIALITLIWK